MKIYQMKVVQKNTKPIAWKRCLVPAGITFSQLALILEEITEAALSGDYEYEFYHAKKQIREWKKEEHPAPSYRYTYLCASDTFIDGLLDKEDWFTFRLPQGESYRVEKEQCLSEGAAFPSVIKQKGQFHTGAPVSQDTLNAILERRYFVTYGRPDYRSFATLWAEQEEGQEGLRGTLRPKDREKRIELSVEIMTQKIADILRKRHEKPWAVSGLSVMLLLMHDTKDALLALADELDLLHYKTLNKENLAEKIRDEILKPEVMEKAMALLSDEEMQAFETAVDKENGFYPEQETLEKLYTAQELYYLAIYSDDYVQVPYEVISVYHSINTPEFQEKRRKTYWLYHCLLWVDMLYGSAPVKILCRLMEKCAKRKIGRKEIEALWSNIFEKQNPCVLRGEKVISKEALRDNLYLKIEETQAEKDFYLPDPQELIEYTEHGYPVSDPYYNRLKLCLTEVKGVDAESIEETMRELFMHISVGAMPSDIIDILEEKNVVFPSDEALQELVFLLMTVHNNTRMLSNRGWKPNELRERMSPLAKGKRTTIVPMSSEAASILEEASDQLEKMGVVIDFDQMAAEMSGMPETSTQGKKKIYPNDPCPCGSGKKYKNCCGRKK